MNFVSVQILDGAFGVRPANLEVLIADRDRAANTTPSRHSSGSAGSTPATDILSTGPPPVPTIPRELSSPTPSRPTLPTHLRIPTRISSRAAIPRPPVTNNPLPGRRNFSHPFNRPAPPAPSPPRPLLRSVSTTAIPPTSVRLDFSPPSPSPGQQIATAPRDGKGKASKREKIKGFLSRLTPKKKKKVKDERREELDLDGTPMSMREAARMTPPHSSTGAGAQEQLSILTSPDGAPIGEPPELSSELVDLMVDPSTADTRQPHRRPTSPSPLRASTTPEPSSRAREPLSSPESSDQSTGTVVRPSSGAGPDRLPPPVSQDVPPWHNPDLWVPVRRDLDPSQRRHRMHPAGPPAPPFPPRRPPSYAAPLPFGFPSPPSHRPGMQHSVSAPPRHPGRLAPNYPASPPPDFSLPPIPPQRSPAGRSYPAPGRPPMDRSRPPDAFDRHRRRLSSSAPGTARQQSGNRLSIPEVDHRTRATFVAPGPSSMPVTASA